MLQRKIATASLPWEPIDDPGVFMKMIYMDPRTGGSTLLLRVDPGVTFPAHFHTKADETVFVISRDFIEDGQTYGPGSFLTEPAGTPHGPHHSHAGCVMLATYSAAIDFQPI